MTRKMRRDLQPVPLLFVMARTAGGRPTLVHQLIEGTSALTLCGRDMTGWSRIFLNSRQVAPFITLMHCKRCGVLAQKEMAA